MIARAIARHWPFKNGSGRIVDRMAAKVDLGFGERTAMTSEGFPMRVMAHDLIGRHLLLTGKFDRSVIQVLLDQARAGDTLLDVGANIGYVSACFLTRVKNSQAICIDPQPGVADLLLTNMRQFGGRAVVHQLALSDKSGELRFHIDVANRGASRINDDGEVVVRAVAASELLADIQKVDLIKIDVEGHEEAVLRSMLPELRRLKPRAILFENHDTGAAPTGALGSILTTLDYRIFGIQKNLLSTRLLPITAPEDCRFNDYLAVA